MVNMQFEYAWRWFDLHAMTTGVHVQLFLLVGWRFSKCIRDFAAMTSFMENPPNVAFTGVFVSVGHVC